MLYSYTLDYMKPPARIEAESAGEALEKLAAQGIAPLDGVVEVYRQRVMTKEAWEYRVWDPHVWGEGQFVANYGA